MNKLLLIVSLLATFSACNPIKKPSDSGVSKVEEESAKEPYYFREPLNVTPNLVIRSQEDLLGYWVGDFYPDNDRMLENHLEEEYSYNKINISIDSLSGDSVFGHSVVAGNRRPFNGHFKLENQVYSFTVSEPGDDKYDGVFNFRIVLTDSLVKGTWAAYGKIKIPYRTFTLKKHLFAYNPDIQLEYTYVDQTKNKKIMKDYGDDEKYLEEGMLASTTRIFEMNPSSRELTARELETLTKGDLIILRNSIYAKHGYSFKKSSLRNYFDGLDWYIPVYTDIKRFLTETEKKNIKNMLNYEKHAKEYYDVFGR